MLTFSNTSKADFIYKYTSNIFSVTAESYYDNGIDGPGFYPETYDAFVTATINTPNMFKNGDELSSDMTILMTGSIFPFSEPVEL